MLRSLRNIERSLGEANNRGYKRVKILEQAGSKLKSVLTRGDPWASQPCHRSTCSTCQGDERSWGSCKVRNVVYQNICKRCAEGGVTTRYLGETARALWERSREHQQDALGGAERSHI